MASSTEGGLQRCAVIGHPVAHSLSPLLHRSAYAQLGIDAQYRYDAFDVSPSELGDFISGLGPDWIGLSVTAPHKEALLGFGEPTPIAAQLRAGNTLILGHDGQPNQVHNTDVTGFVAALESVGVRAIDSAIVVGAGATARSCLAALQRLGAQAVTVLARDESRAMASLRPIAELANLQLNWRAMDSGDLPAADLLVNTAPVNLSPELAARLVASSRVIFEAVYNFYPSNLDQAAETVGKIALDGMHLLVFQAVDQLRLMTGRDVDAQQLLEVGHRALASRSS